MTEVTDAEVGQVDLAVVAYRDEGDWSLSELPDRSLDSVDTIAKELRRYPGENGALALISVAEDFVLLVRAQGSLVRVLLSDATAATDWSLARSAVDHIGFHVDDDRSRHPPATSRSSRTWGCPRRRWARCWTTTTSTPRRSS